MAVTSPVSPPDSKSSSWGTSIFKAPIPARTASHRVREWIKRSGSSSGTSAAAKVTAGPAGSEIVHHGGCRVGNSAEAPIAVAHDEPSLPSTTIRRRPQASRASSTDSRVTQWIDLYPEPLEALVVPKQRREASSSRPSKQSQSRSSLEDRPQQHRLSKSEGDLCPAPLRVRQTQTQTQMLVRKNSKWKPLPGLPSMWPATEKEGDNREKPVTARPDNPAIKDEKKTAPEIKPQTITHGNMHLRLPYGIASPPPTPDSGGTPSGTAQGQGEPKSDNSNEEGLRVSQPASITVSRSQRSAARHSRQERMWLHQNYRGEAPFLDAWGLNIKNEEDREEGSRILRDLMQAERETLGRKDSFAETDRKRLRGTGTDEPTSRGLEGDATDEFF
ncbi:hypothetical protein QBC46DRAFT_267467 [Diplogelasinospora grovesii]|uniref:Uncharacterized protein n=1 Tax=Diplogelasinospora grovesii TaxID=303347 RepID=A0AAN6N4W6_9PEZI|nr:hypothetical protein QBC46DRAFT_267467 [Diplogelasinospora grovesii]